MKRFEHGGNVYAHPGCLDFSANLNPLGMPAAAREALVRGVDAFEAYPDPACTELVAALAAFEGVPPEWVVACAGATDAFARLCAALRPRAVLVCAPCYSGYEQAAEQVGARVVRHLLEREGGFVATRALADAIVCGVDMAFLANPNNPTGRCLPRDVLASCLGRARETGTVVVLDECFVDLTRRAGSNDLLASHPGLVLVKACTKTFSLAGLRLGYALCADEGLCARLRDVGQPWAVSVPAQVAGVACLGDVDYLRRSQELVARERERLGAALAARGLNAIPGEANYLLFEGPEGLDAQLLHHRVLVRSCENYVGLDGRWFRIAVRTPEENDRLVHVLGEVLP